MRPTACLPDLVGEPPGGVLLDAHVDEGAGGGERGLHLGQPVLHRLQGGAGDSDYYRCEAAGCARAR